MRNSSVSYATTARSSKVEPQKVAPVMAACIHVVENRLATCKCEHACRRWKADCMLACVCVSLYLYVFAYLCVCVRARAKGATSTRT